MRTLLAVAAVTLALASPAAAGGRADLAFDGGSVRQQAQVRAALAASAFDFRLLGRPITVHIAPGTDSAAVPGEVWLDADLLDSGRFAWSTVQHEFAHQVDFLLLDDAQRVQLRALLGGADWCYETPGLGHDAHGCERFAETLAAAYAGSSDATAHAFAPVARFRALLDRLLGLAPAQAYRLKR
jgi:hypothetical protein